MIVEVPQCACVRMIVLVRRGVVAPLAACSSSGSDKATSHGASTTTAARDAAARRSCSTGRATTSPRTSPSRRSPSSSSTTTTTTRTPTGSTSTGRSASTRSGRDRFVAGEDTLQDTTGHPGWGILELAGTEIGELSVKEVGKLVPTYQPSNDNPENYGCGFLADGRILTTDVGNQATGTGRRPADRVVPAVRVTRR